MSSYGRGTNRLELRVDPEARPGWVFAKQTTVHVGDEVYTAEGAAEVVRIFGKTSNGSPLLELRLVGQSKRQFFASCSNVLVAPRAV
jgi:hypothetical protein